MLKSVAVIESYLKTMSELPGVYRMLDEDGKVLYVGKAKNLAKRVANYTQFNKLSYRIQMMVSKTASMEIITTKNEAEALLLEANLIKHYQPRYNILLKDDKSFPFIEIRRDHPYSQITKHRGKKKAGNIYFGPFASSKDVNNTVTLLQKIFLLRPCTDNYFSSRKRPCIQYQIKRCSAPCVGKISETEYKDLVDQACSFLSGKSQKLQEELIRKMNEASEKMDYETAVIYRDRIKSIASIVARQNITSQNIGDADFIAVVEENGNYAIEIFFYRGGRNFGNKSYFPIHTEEATQPEILSVFLGRFYQSNPPPKHIYVSDDIEDIQVIEDALYSLYNYKTKIFCPKLGDKLALIDIVKNNAKEALKRKVADYASQYEVLQKVQELFELDEMPKRIEVYDNSHIMGKYAVGAMIVAGKEGFIKNEYRRFTINNMRDDVITGGDDYAMLREVLTRRFSRLLKEHPNYEEGVWPDLVMIDGGANHLKVVTQIFEQFDILDKIALVAIAKGVDRNAGKEFFHQNNKEPFTLPRDLAEMKYLQILRDEAHNYAIKSHRTKRSNALKISELDNISNIGSKRKKALIESFGSIQNIEKANIEDLIKVKGISKSVAEEIYKYFHRDH